MKKILVTGITGFVGSFLAEKLSSHSDFKIYGTYLTHDSLSNISHVPDITSFQVDLNNYHATEDIISDVKPDEIYHLAASTSAGQSFQDPGPTIINNITSELNLLEAVRKQNLSPKILITSSAEVYGAVSKEDIPVDEKTPFRPASPYAVSKIAQDYLGYQYFISYKLNILRVRPFNHIGPRQAPHFVTSAFAKQIAQIEKGEIPPVMKVGNLDSKRDFTDVRDMVEAYELLMEKGKSGDVYNIGSGVSHKISDILNTLLSFSNVSITIEKDQTLFRASDTPDLYCDITKVKNLTGWEPKIPLQETLKNILDYWRQIV